MGVPPCPLRSGPERGPRGLVLIPTLLIVTMLASVLEVGGNGDQLHRQHRPDCDACTGCTHTLRVLSAHGSKVLFNRTFSDEAGASSNWLFLANSTETEDGSAIVKVACVPVPKTRANTRAPVCHPDLTARHAKLYLALQKLSEDCGFTDIVPKVWLQEISAVVPDVGYHIHWHAVWMSRAPGISLENLVRLGSPPMRPAALLDFLHTRLNKTQVVLAAIFDLLTSQCDRHAQNVFLDETGRLMLIDNERCLYENHWCAIDSILLPTTKKYAIHVFENAWVNKFRDWGQKTPSSWANPPLLLDYRCWVEGGKIGKAWPPRVGACLKKLSAMSSEDIQREYGLPNEVTAQALKNRSQAMFEHGFEEALTGSLPANPNPWRYRWTEPCCHITHTDMYRCADDTWQPKTDLPFGDPITGKAWRRTWRDVGTYEGGT